MRRMSRSSTRRVLILATLIAACTGGCKFGQTLRISNGSGHTLTPYPVDATLSPPQRVADPANDVANGAMGDIDPHGFNPVYYASLPLATPDQANGLFFGLSMDDEPYLLQYRVFHYRVPPGQEGAEPNNQPLLLDEGFVEIEDEPTLIDVKARANGSWGVSVRPE